VSIEERLDAIEARLDALEAHGSRPARPPSPADVLSFEDCQSA
jgi:hypothetical protein